MIDIQSMYTICAGIYSYHDTHTVRELIQQLGKHRTLSVRRFPQEKPLGYSATRSLAEDHHLEYPSSKSEPDSIALAKTTKRTAGGTRFVWLAEITCNWADCSEVYRPK